THTIILGRDPACDVHLDDRRVSRQHARIEPEDDGSLLLVDNGSSNGTYVNGEEVGSHHLALGDRIGLGKGVQLTVASFGSLHERTVASQRAAAAHRVAHEAGTAFSALFEGMLARGATPEVVAELAREGLEAARTLARTGAPRAEVQDIDLAQVLSAIEEALDDTSRVTIDAEPELEVSGDPEGLVQAVLEVVAAALAAGPGPVTVEAGLVDPDERSLRKLWLADVPHAVIRVRDAGEMPVWEHPEEPFAPEGHRDLSLAAGIVRAHEGRLVVHSSGGATTVRIYLPLVLSEG
ncbi:MAG: FHA domain-containing protein, partial [Myxococcales bacterium]|nr:FHA domain-containing protein [Myxococcales bacterium]